MIDENDEFDRSVDPYDRNIDFDYDDGISDMPVDELDAADEDEWDTQWDDETVVPVAVSADEIADYDEIED